MRNISAVEGKTATLSCTVRNLGDRRVSIWKMMMVVVMVMLVMVMMVVVMRMKMVVTLGAKNDYDYDSCTIQQCL